MLDEASPLPLYRQLAALLGEQIADGSYGAGDRIPSEPDLCRRHGIGRPTVRQATELLVRKGLLERRRGSGTFVRPASGRVDMFSRAGTLSSFQESGLSISARWLRPVEQVQVPTSDGHLPNPFGGGTALYVARQSLHEGEAVLLERFWLDEQAFASLAGEELAERALSEIAERDLGLVPGATEQVFDVARLDADAAGCLALPTGAPVLRVMRQVTFTDSPACIFAALYCRTDRLAFVQTLHGDHDV